MTCPLNHFVVDGSNAAHRMLEQVTVDGGFAALERVNLLVLVLLAVDEDGLRLRLLRAAFLMFLGQHLVSCPPRLSLLDSICISSELFLSSHSTEASASNNWCNMAFELFNTISDGFEITPS